MAIPIPLTPIPLVKLYTSPPPPPSLPLLISSLLFSSFLIQVGKYAKAQFLDGVDFDLENFDEGFTVNGHSAAWTINWCVNITRGAENGFGM